MSAPRIAVIDIGSNSIKLLVAERDPTGALTGLFQQTIDARISAGISQAEPCLSEAGMERGLGAVQDLLAAARPYGPSHTVLVATSAVRDARNGPEFRASVRQATGHEVRILTGNEEAELIGRGLAADPALNGQTDFYVFDLGGGSLECLAYESGHRTQATSLPLGCVRLTERFCHGNDGRISPEEVRNIQAHVRDALNACGFSFARQGMPGIFAGGSMTTVRAILAAQKGLALAESPSRVAVEQLRELSTRLNPLPLAERQRIPGLPAARADVFPAALATMIAVAELAGIVHFQHSAYNLRWGVASMWEGTPN